MFCFVLLLLIKASIKHVVASAQAQLFLLVITVGNTFPLVITVGNMLPLVLTVGNTLPLVVTVENTFPPLITVGKNNGSLITVGKNNGSSFFLRKRGTSEMSSMVRHTLLSSAVFLLPYLRFLLIYFAWEMKGFCKSSLGSEVDLRYIINISSNILAKN